MHFHVNLSRLYFHIWFNVCFFTLQKIETKDSETIIIVYFDDISSKSVCPEFKAYKTSSVAKHKPAPVKIYDYYDNCKLILISLWTFSNFLPLQLVARQAFTAPQKSLFVIFVMAPKNARKIVKRRKSTWLNSLYRIYKYKKIFFIKWIVKKMVCFSL